MKLILQLLLVVATLSTSSLAFARGYEKPCGPRGYQPVRYEHKRDHRRWPRPIAYYKPFRVFPPWIIINHR